MTDPGQPLGILGHDIAPAQQRDLMACARLRSVPGGTRLFSEGQAADRFFLVRAGVVTISLAVPHYGNQVLETLLPGHLVGWSWLDWPYRWRFNATTAEPSELLEFDAERVRDLCTADPVLGRSVARTVLAVVAHRLHASRLRLLDLYAADARERP